MEISNLESGTTCFSLASSLHSGITAPTFLHSSFNAASRCWVRTPLLYTLGGEDVMWCCLPARFLRESAFLSHPLYALHQQSICIAMRGQKTSRWCNLFVLDWKSLSKELFLISNTIICNGMKNYWIATARWCITCGSINWHQTIINIKTMRCFYYNFKRVI